jgi:peptidoglycan/LPS O-acetylase OafA/YrhL
VNVQNPRYPLFDSLRAIAALTVVGFHVAFLLGGFTRPGVDRYVTQLNIGVTIFFVISGFLLYRPYAAARFARARMPALVPYAIRRLFRIVPAYWFALPIAAVLISRPEVFHNPLPYFGLAQVYDPSTVTGGYGIAWTLCVEVSFYAMLPLWALAVRALPARTGRQFALTEGLGLAALFAVGVVWNASLDVHVHAILGFTREMAVLPTYLDHFALGMALAVASVVLAERARQPAVIRLVHRAPWLPWVAAAGGWLALANIDSGGPTHGITNAIANALPAGQSWRHEVRGLVALCVLVPAVFGQESGGFVRRLLANRVLQWLGLISYSIYLWHVAILERMVFWWHWERSLGGLGFAIVGVATVIAVAAAAFYLVESRALRLGRRLAGRRGSQEPDGPPRGAADGAGASSVELAGAEPRP